MDAGGRLGQIRLWIVAPTIVKPSSKVYSYVYKDFGIPYSFVPQF